MKKSIAVLMGCLVSTSLWAASTCESRVDNHVHQSTTERVNYCLEADPENTQEDDGPTVIMSETYSAKFPKQKEQTTTVEQKTITAYQATPISLEYTDRETYPPFRNDIWPYMTSYHADQAAKQALKEQRQMQEKQKKAKKAAKSAKKTKKPARKQVAAAQPVSAQTTPAQATPAPEAQVAQAEALQNDPLAQNPTNNGTTPDGFLEDDLMGPADFGYNATDPAYQQ